MKIGFDMCLKRWKRSLWLGRCCYADTQSNGVWICSSKVFSFIQIVTLWWIYSS